MADKLVIVESPSKAKTIGKYLGRGYKVTASMGHVRDLPKSQLGVDVEHDFTPKYLVPREKAATVKELKALVKSADTIFLATDPDREGEAIAWHLVHATGLDPAVKKVSRVEFHEITKDAIKQAVSHPRPLNMDLVNAQQTRRILDRLVGYTISPLLWDRMGRKGLSAGRVQSVAVRLIVDREREVEAFEPVEYWTLEAELWKGAGGKPKKGETFRANLHSVAGVKADLKTEAETMFIVNALADAEWTVGEVRQTKSSRKPSPPFTTSTLTQEASRKLNYTSKRTMLVAQQLYEGVEIGKEGTIGLITYMRTDSTNIASVAQEEARTMIAARYGADYVPETPPVYTKKSKNAQEAHEAIRPTSSLRDPDSIKAYLSTEQYKMYSLIWKRFVASQMNPAQLDQTSVDVKAGDPGTVAAEKPYLFRATGSVIRFPGFLIVYQESLDDGAEDEVNKKALPPLAANDALSLLNLDPQQHFTQPPPRFTEATLIKTLEELGIGRPSTYAPTLATIQERGYVERIEKKFVPTELGVQVNSLMVNHFPNIVDSNFTSQMEEELDEIANGARQWIPVLSDFYTPFDVTVQAAKETMPRLEVKNEPVGEDCPQCSSPLVYRIGRFGKFVACTGFSRKENQCRYTRPIPKLVGAHCPQCGAGDLIEKKTKKKRLFYGCSRYPDCEFSVWDRPLGDAYTCAECGGLLLVSGKSNAKCHACGTVVPRPEIIEAGDDTGGSDMADAPDLELVEMAV